MEQFSPKMTSYKIGFRYSAHLLHQGAYGRKEWLNFLTLLRNTMSAYVVLGGGNHVGVEKRPNHVCVMDQI